MGINKEILLDSKDRYKNHTLSAHLKADSFVYGIMDENGLMHKVVSYGDVTSTDLVHDIINDIKLEGASKICLAYGDKPFLMSPVAEDVMTEVIPHFDNKTIHSDRLTGYDTYTNFGLNSVMQGIVNGLGEVYHTHMSNVFEHALYPNNDHKLLAFFEENTLHVTYLTPESFIHYNQFYCETKEDFLYYILATYKALELDTRKNILQVAGNISKGGEIYDLIYDYIDTIVFPVNGGSLVASSIQEPHQFYDLFNIARCAS